MATTPRRPNTAARARELLVLASMMATVLWGIAIIDAASGTSRGRVSGLPIGTDFINFYTLAHIGAQSRYQVLATLDTFHAEQVRVLPDSDAVLYPPVYPPQVALLLGPLARFNVLAGVLRVGHPEPRTLRRDRLAIRARHTGPGSVAMAGDSSGGRESCAMVCGAARPSLRYLALAALAMGWAGLRHERPLLAGFALGALAFKPSLYVPALALLLAAREWRMAMGAVAGHSCAPAYEPPVGRRRVDLAVTSLTPSACWPRRIRSQPIRR